MTTESNPGWNISSYLIPIKILFSILIAFFLLIELSTFEFILDQMLTSGDRLPLQQFLNTFHTLWVIVDSIGSFLLGSYLYELIFRTYAWGGFTFAALSWMGLRAIEWKADPDYTPVDLSEKEKRGRLLVLIYMLVLLLSIIYGLNRDLWVPYFQDLRWEINLKHKQQLSAGSFMIVFFLVWATGILPNTKMHQGSRKFYQYPYLLTYVFLIFMLDNIGSYNWFVDGWGYEEIFRYGQDWLSFDKVFHFTMSSAVTVLILMYLPRPILTASIVVFLAVFWELFEISLNPREISDSGLDMVINSSAIVLTALIFNQYNKTNEGP